MMDESGFRIDPYREVGGALRRAGLDSAEADTGSGLRRTLAFRRARRRRADRRANSLDAHFDPSTGLPLASALPHVVNDGLVLRSLTGRIAVASVEVPEISARRIGGDEDAARAVVNAITHRLRLQGWAGDAHGPFGPLIFLRRPGVFVVVLRDVLDERTTRWLAGRVHALLDEGVPWNGTVIAPRVVMGVAVGLIAEAEDLVARADGARIRARREPARPVVFHGDHHSEQGRGQWVVAHEGAPYARVLDDPSPVVADLFTSARDLRRRLDATMRSLERENGRWLLPVSAATLCHRPTRQCILSAVNHAGAHRRLGLVVPSTLDDRLFAEAWKALGLLRRAGVEVHLDSRDPGAVDEPLPSQPVDGVIVRAGIDGRTDTRADALVAAALARGLRVLTHECEAIDREPVLAAATSATGTNRLILPGHPTQEPKGPVVTIR